MNFAQIATATLACLLALSLAAARDLDRQGKDPLASERQAAGRAVDAAKNESERATALARLGDVLRAQGDPVGAVEPQSECARIFRRLASSERTSERLHLDLIVSLTKLGNTQVEIREIADALATYQEQLVIVRRFVSARPDSAEWRNLLVVSLHQLGDVHLTASQHDEALTAYRESLEVSRSLADADTHSAELQHQVGVSTIKIGQVKIRSGDAAGARASFQRSLEILRPLAAADPDATDVHRDLVVTLVRVNELTGDEAYLREGLEVAAAMEKHGILSPDDAWMVENLRGRIGKDEAVDICPGIKAAIELGENDFVDLAGGPSSKTFEPSWARDCEVTRNGVADWSCNVAYDKGLLEKEGFALLDQRLDACLGPEWETTRKDYGMLQSVIHQKGNITITMFSSDTSAHLSISRER